MSSVTKHRFYGVEMAERYFASRIEALHYYRKYFTCAQDTLEWIDLALKYNFLQITSDKYDSRKAFLNDSLKVGTGFNILFIEGIRKVQVRELHTANIVLQDLAKSNEIPGYYVWKNRYGPDGYLLHKDDIGKFIDDPTIKHIR